MAVVGIGASPGSHGVDYQSVMGQLPADVQADLQREGVVGDLCAHMFAGDGRFVEHEVSRRTLSIGVDELRRVPCVVAVAGGVNKATSLLGRGAHGRGPRADHRPARRRAARPAQQHLTARALRQRESPWGWAASTG